MTDDDLAAAFEAGALEPAGFRHREHVRLAWVLIGRFGPDEAGARLLGGLRAVAERAGTPERFDRGLTLAWVAAVYEAMTRNPEARTFDALVAARPDLLDRRAVRAAV